MTITPLRRATLIGSAVGIVLGIAAFLLQGTIGQTLAFPGMWFIGPVMIIAATVFPIVLGSDWILTTAVIGTLCVGNAVFFALVGAAFKASMKSRLILLCILAVLLVIDALIAFIVNAAMSI